MVSIHRVLVPATFFDGRKRCERRVERVGCKDAVEKSPRVEKAMSAELEKGSACATLLLAGE